MQRRGGSGQQVKGRPRVRKAPTAHVSTAHSAEQFDRLKRERDEALEREAATAQILTVISNSPTDTQPVFDAIVQSGMKLFPGATVIIALADGDKVVAAAVAAPDPASAEAVRRRFPSPLTREYMLGTAILDDRIVDIPDAENAPAELAAGARNFLASGHRAQTIMPLMRGDRAIGVLSVARLTPGPLSDKQFAVLKTFASQAVIAIENTRRFNETREALERQTATAEVLQVINSSPGDLAPVFDVILEKAHRLCGAAQGSLQLYDGAKFRAVAVHGLPEAFADRLRQGAISAGPKYPALRLLEGARFVQIPDQGAIDDPMSRAAFEAGIRTNLFIPLRKEGILLGRITASRREVKLFTEKEIELLESFAAQAVIAMENARLLNETKEALERQTVTADILKVIASSPSDVQPVFDAIAASAGRLLGSYRASVFLFIDGMAHLKAFNSITPEADEALKSMFPRPVADFPPFRMAQAGGIMQVPDTEAAADGLRDIARVRGFRSAVFVPLMNKGSLIGTIGIARGQPGSFAEHHLQLLQTFADQAVIAIENARLFDEVQAKTHDLEESLKQQTATSEVLQVVSSSPGDLAPVFDKLLENATRVCGAEFGSMLLVEGDSLRQAALYNVPPALAAVRANRVFRIPAQGALATALRSKQVVHVADVRDSQAYLERVPASVEFVELGGARTVVFVPMLREDEVIGAIDIYRQEVRLFDDKQIELLGNFAKQAVIAIENTRLLNELRQSLQQQTATADVLKIISRSAVELETVLDTLVETVTRLCRADQAHMFGRQDDKNHLLAAYGLTEEAKDFVLTHPFAADRGTISGRVVLDRRVVHVHDVLQDPEFNYWVGQKLVGARTMLGIPLLREDTLIGVFLIIRTRVEPFTGKEIELATTFADQAVIAIENARLFEELRDRQAELARSVDELTATSDVLKIISRSTVGLETVLDTLVETVARLCRADHSTMFRRRDEWYDLVASRGFSEEAKEFFLTNSVARGRGTMAGRVELERRAVHIPDVLQDPGYTYTEAQRIAGYRTTLGIPLLREDSLIGLFIIARTRVEPFTDKEIELATSFADQAVIAIENARLFEELRDRQAELRVTFDNMGDGVVMFDAAGRLSAWNRNFRELIELPESFLAGRPTRAEYFRYLADRGEFVTADLEAQLGSTVEDAGLEMRYERTRPDGSIIEVRRNPVPDGGSVLIYSDITKRKRAEETIHAARDAAETALRELQAAQASLVHAQKMAALGQLTAGIAHEIKNPLNFVNNFAGLSVELLEELKEAAAEAIGTMDTGKRSEIFETIRMLTGNLERIAEHGRRADGIVRGMLQHSRGSSGDWQATDLNALVEESLNLAYHGARAQDQAFKIALELDLDRNLAPIEVVSQDISRVLLNLISNGFYAVTRRGQEIGGAFRPLLKIATRECDESVEIRVRDNGVGIAAEHREKLFQPFFTTKPTGEGTGLGLSISYEIITQQHGGTITVDSEVGNFTEFTVRVPRRRHGVA